MKTSFWRSDLRLKFYNEKIIDVKIKISGLYLQFRLQRLESHNDINNSKIISPLHLNFLIIINEVPQ